MTGTVLYLLAGFLIGMLTSNTNISEKERVISSSSKVSPVECINKVNSNTDLTRIKLGPYNPPPKTELKKFKFDYPRLRDYYELVNSQTCLNWFKSTELYNGSKESYIITKDVYLNKIPRDKRSCFVNAIDHNSNLFVGLDEKNFKILIYDFNVLVNREKEWMLLLKKINKDVEIINGESRDGK